MKTLILGLGNPILSDDGIGLRVAEELEGKLNKPDVTIMEGGVTCLITSAKKATPIVRGVDLILGRDKRAMRYMKNYRERTAAAKK